jgi:hypothetical protein
MSALSQQLEDTALDKAILLSQPFHPNDPRGLFDSSTEITWMILAIFDYQTIVT